MGTKQILKSQKSAGFRPYGLTDFEFGPRIPLFRWKGFIFNADRTLFLILVALILSLRFRLFPFFYSNLSPAEYWGMALIAGLGIALSVIAHEMVHVVVARRMGERPYGLFLFLFGSGTPVELTGATRAKRTALYLSGVLFSVLLSATLVLLAFLTEINGRNEFVIGILFHLGAFNMTLAIFQLLPVLPLDGGRFALNLISRDGILRPRVVTAFYFLGSLIGVVLVGVGGYQMYEHRPVLGSWVAVVGLMLLKANYQQYLYLMVKSRIGDLARAPREISV